MGTARNYLEAGTNYQVIAMDNRGHGSSGKPHDPKQYGVEMVADVIRLLDHLQIKKAAHRRLFDGRIHDQLLVDRASGSRDHGNLGGRGLVAGGRRADELLDRAGRIAGCRQGNRPPDRALHPGRPSQTDQEQIDHQPDADADQ